MAPVDPPPGCLIEVVLAQLGELKSDIKGISGDLQDVKVTLARREQDADEVSRLRDKVEALTTEVTALKVKSGIWGLLGGALPAIGAVLFVLLK